MLDSHFTPSLELVACVRHAEPAMIVPDELTAFVQPLYIDDHLDDWWLTSDALAFGSESVVQRFEQWRSEWEQSWVLDPISSVARLLDRADERPDVVDGVLSAVLAPVLDDAQAGRESTVDAVLAPAIVPAIDSLRDQIRQQRSTGWGFVNATRGYAGVGLARAWSPFGGAELIAADQDIRVVIDPTTGLGVELLYMDGQQVTEINRVEVTDRHFEVHHTDPSGQPAMRLVALERSRPLGWIVPNAIEWKIIKIPEVVVWARTFAGLIDCCQRAADLDSPMRFATRATPASHQHSAP